MPERPTSRRDFLQGRSATEALRGVGTSWGEKGEAASSPAATLSVMRRAMACDFQVRLHATATQNETEAALAALDAIELAEDRLTVYRDQSELIDLNHEAACGPADVEPDLWEVLLLADRLHAASGGAFDLTAGPLSEAWGFARREGRLPTADQLTAARARVGWGGVRLDTDSKTLAFARPDLQINVNSVGKGFALDLASDVLRRHGVRDALLNGGRSTLVAFGARPGGDGAVGWGVGVRHPLRPNQYLAEFDLCDAAFSTSGSATQCFVHDGKRYGHLIDPRSGWPADGLHSVSVVAPTGAEADALSTAFYVMGHAASTDYCRSRPEIQALFVLPGEREGAVDLRGENLDRECWRLANRV